MYSYVKERIKHAIRFRHKRGFGVHSPFMFHLILNVIRDKDNLYTYPERAEKKAGIRYKERKFYRLLYRLASYLEVKQVTCLSAHAENAMLYLEELSPETVVSSNRLSDLQQADFVYLGRDARVLLQNQWPRLLALAAGQKRCVVVTHIYKNSFNAKVWQELRREATVTVDMMWYGILFFDEKLQKGRYNLII